MTFTESLFSENENLKVEVESFQIRGQRDQEKIKHLESEVSYLHEMIRGLKRLKFGRKSERWESEEQLLFNEVEVEAKKKGSEDEVEIEVKGHTKKRGHRKALPEGLPREVVIIELPEIDRVDEDGNVLKKIGETVSEKLICEPEVMKIQEIHRIKYGRDAGDYEKTAPPKPSIIPKGIVTESLLANIVVKKFCYGLPLYRQEEIFKRLGVDVPRNTQGRWIIKGFEACLPIKNILEDWLLESPYVSCDETWTQVLKEKGRTAESKSWMWVRATPGDKNKIVLFDYDPHRSQEVVKKLLADYKGYLQCDGLNIYDVLEKSKEIIRVGCNMHGRRKFEHAFKDGAKQGQSLAREGLRFYKLLYELEEEIREMPPDERHKIRQEKALPIFEEFKLWVDKNAAKVPPRSKIGEAFRYFRNEYLYLIAYLKDGRLEMDNGFVERMIRKFAIGRNNWLFSDTEDGAEASSLFYSFVVTIKINGGDPYKILKYVFEQVPLAKTVEDYERLAAIIIGRSPIP